jgi:DNA-binding GntR family transcriptional regulator
VNFGIKIQRARATTNYDARPWVESIEEHEAVMEAFRARAPDRVAKTLVDHTRRTGAAVMATLLRVRDLAILTPAILRK